jgi:hypothetical protein
MKKVFFAVGLIVFSFPAMAEMAERSTFKVIDNNTFKYSRSIDHIFSHCTKPNQLRSFTIVLSE